MILSSNALRRRDFLIKLLAVPAAAAVAIPLLTDDAAAQQPFPPFPGKTGKGKGKGKGKDKGKDKGKGAGKGRGPAGTGKGKGGGKGKGKNFDSTEDPAPGNQSPGE